MTLNIRKLTKSPEVTFDYDIKHEALMITVEMPDIDSERYELTISTCGFCISAETPGIQYQGCYRFYHEVDGNSAKIKLKNGTLSIKVPFFAPICGRQFPVDFDQ